MSWPARAAVARVSGYQALLSPMLGRHCRFAPTCSEYALESIRVHGAIAGTWMAIKRICRCHPWGGCGDDPVPPARDSALSSNWAPHSGASR